MGRSVEVYRRNGRKVDLVGKVLQQAATIRTRTLFEVDEFSSLHCGIEDEVDDYCVDYYARFLGARAAALLAEIEERQYENFERERIETLEEERENPSLPARLETRIRREHKAYSHQDGSWHWEQNWKWWRRTRYHRIQVT